MCGPASVFFSLSHLAHKIPHFGLVQLKFEAFRMHWCAACCAQALADAVPTLRLAPPLTLHTSVMGRVAALLTSGTLTGTGHSLTGQGLGAVGQGQGSNAVGQAQGSGAVGQGQGQERYVRTSALEGPSVGSGSTSLAHAQPDKPPTPHPPTSPPSSPATPLALPQAHGQAVSSPTANAAYAGAGVCQSNADACGAHQHFRGIQGNADACKA